MEFMVIFFIVGMVKKIFLIEKMLVEQDDLVIEFF